MTYIIPNILNSLIKIPCDMILVCDNHAMNYEKYKTHKTFLEISELFDDEHSHYICKVCNLKIIMKKNWIRHDEVYTRNNLSCEEMIIKNIIE